MTNPGTRSNISNITRDDCAARDARDPLAPLREQFHIPPNTIYLDGNSLGALPRSTESRVRQVIADEWGQDLIRSWNTAGWLDQPQRVGDKIARLIGAGAGEVIAADSTSLNLYKVLSVALAMARADAPARHVIVSERDNFPTDLYIAQSLANQHGHALELVSAGEIPSRLTGDVAVLMLTHVNYRTGRMHDMTALTAAAHAAGALVIWDLAHSAGAVPVDLRGADADFAIGCGYKYLNGGPGSPAFVWLNARHAARMDATEMWQPLSGWLGHAAPFEFTTDYRPARAVRRFTAGTPSPIAIAALECGVDTVLAAEPLGGMNAIRDKSLTLTDLFIDLLRQRCGDEHIEVQTPADHSSRGSQVSFTLGRRQSETADENESRAYATVQALIARGVIGDFRAPGILRFGFTPLYLRYVDVWDAVEQLADVVKNDRWRDLRFMRRAAVT